MVVFQLFRDYLAFNFNANRGFEVYFKRQPRESGFRNPGNFCLWNPESGPLNSEYSSRNPEPHYRLESGIQVPLNDWRKKSGIQPLESGIQDCLSQHRPCWAVEVLPLRRCKFFTINAYFYIRPSNSAS